MEGRNRQTQIQNCKMYKLKWALFHILCMFMAITITQWKSYAATKNTDSSSDRLHCSMSSLLTAWPHVPSSECLTLCLGVSLLSDCPSALDLLMSFSSGLAGFHRHSSLCSLHANIDKKRSSGHSGAASKMPEIRSPLWPPIHEHTERPTHIHSFIHPSIYIYIYIYIYKCSLSCHKWGLTLTLTPLIYPAMD